MIKKKIDFQKTLTDAASLMTRLKRPERMLKVLTRYVDRHFGLTHTSFALFDEAKNRFTFMDSKGLGRIPLSLVRMDSDHPIVQAFRDKKFLKTVLKSNYLHRSDLAKLALGRNDEAARLLKAMDFLKAELVIPGYEKHNLQGLLLLGQKKSKRFFTAEEISFFQVLVQNCTMAARISEYHRVSLEKGRELQRRAEEVEKFRKKENETYYEIMRCLAREVHAKDPYTFGHISQVERLGVMTAKEMGLDMSGKRKDILCAGLILHDVGKIGIPDSILKKPARLNEEEWKIMKTHAEKGAQILEELTDFKEVAEIVHSHHEFFDGKGYPRGLKGEQIPVEARIVSVVDAFHAIVSTRCYSQGRPVETAFEELERCSGTQFDPGVVTAFTRALKREMKKRGVGFFIEETAGAAA